MTLLVILHNRLLSVRKRALVLTAVARAIGFLWINKLFPKLPVWHLSYMLKPTNKEIFTQVALFEIKHISILAEKAVSVKFLFRMLFVNYLLFIFPIILSCR